MFTVRRVAFCGQDPQIYFIAREKAGFRVEYMQRWLRNGNIREHRNSNRRRTARIKRQTVQAVFR